MGSVVGFEQIVQVALVATVAQTAPMVLQMAVAEVACRDMMADY